MELSTSTIDAAQRTVNPNEVLKGEASIGAQNIQAVTLYTYPKSFIVASTRCNLVAYSLFQTLA